MVARDVAFEDSNLPKNFEILNPRVKRDMETGKYVVYGFGLCRLLADSPQKRDALQNADSIMGIIMFLDYVWKNPTMDISSGRVMPMIYVRMERTFWEQLDGIAPRP